MTALTGRCFTGHHEDCDGRCACTCHTPAPVDLGDGLRGRVEQLEQRIAAVMALPDEQPPPTGAAGRLWAHGYADGLADCRAVLRGDL